MAVVTEEARYEVHTYFKEAMGPERAATLMDMLPPAGWGDVATKQDVASTKQDLTAEITLVRNDLTADIALVRNDLTAEITLVRKDLTAEIMLVRKDVDHLREFTEQGFKHVHESMQQGFTHVYRSMAEGFKSQRELTSLEIRGAVGDLRAEFHRVMRIQVLTLVFVMSVLLSILRFG